MALAALSGLMGPQLKDFGPGESYTWSYACCGQSCSGSAELAPEDGGASLGWAKVSGTCVPAAAKSLASRDEKNAHWFVTSEGGVWVLGKATDPMKYYSSEAAATAGGAPTVTAMRRDPSGAKQASSSDDGPPLSKGGGVGYDGARPKPPPKRNLRQEAQEEARRAREEAAELERRAIQEAMTFAKEKDERKKRGDVVA